MATECDHDCSKCSESDCNERKESLKIKQNELSNVKKVFGVVSGKGGVGKSLVTSMLAVLSRRKGLKVAILDADITGPSIPKAFGLKEKATGMDKFLLPVKSKTGISIMSTNLLLENDTDPVLWRGPLLGGTVKQFWGDVVWGDVDYMYVDMPPGTSDVALTVFQSLPLDGIIIVTSPQDLVSMIVGKAVKMANMMNVPIIGIVENMSYFQCKKCGSKHSIYGESHIEEVAKKFGINVISKLPIDMNIATACDRGLIELFVNDSLDELSDLLDEKFEEKAK
ncbi:MAG: Mrp/NBP35 family ATP-binding protein [Clostridia bacterium]